MRSRPLPGLLSQVAGHPCTNVQMMLGMWKPTKVRPSQFGNGLFLGAEQAMKGDLIVEYTGDIIHPRTAFRRTMVSFHTDRNYIFDVDQDGLKYSIDAGAAGNESRFINHPMNGSPNCSARFVYVCGQLRLGIYALQVIYPGQELFIHYGETFFTKEKPKGDPDSDASAVEEGYASGEGDEEDEDEDDDDDSGDSISL
ncbi:SET domain-containing protein [Ceratobasidium sp. AG-I]|nr:SET domain-containing protein [Ceratobasidium sp. AG-I]